MAIECGLRLRRARKGYEKEKKKGVEWGERYAVPRSQLIKL
jgi:hypothetical protein